MGISEKSMNPIAFYSKTLFTFVASYHANASPQGEERTGGMTYYEEGVYLTLCFPAYRNFATFRNCWEQGSGRCLRGYVIHRIDREASCPKEGRVRLVGHYISAWASALLVQTVSGNAKASMCGTSNRYRLPRFLFYMCTCPKVTDFCPAWGV